MVRAWPAGSFVQFSKKEWWERRVSDLQISGRPVYAFRLGCKSDEELKYCLLDSVALIVGEGTVVGYVLGSEGSWERNEQINHALVHLQVVRRKKD
jgi:hypothetical protein